MCEYSHYFTFLILLTFDLIFSFEFLKKYETIEINCENTNLIIFDSSTFEIPSTIHLKFLTDIHTNVIKMKKLSFEFDFREIKDISKYEELKFLLSPILVFNETIDNEDITAYYYNIEKNEEHLSNGFGNNLLISFDCEGKFKIQNTDRDRTVKFSTTAIILICLGGVVLLVIIIIIFVCYFKKNMENPQKETKDKKSKTIKDRRKTVGNIGNVANNYLNNRFAINKIKRPFRKMARGSLGASSTNTNSSRDSNLKFRNNKK